MALNLSSATYAPTSFAVGATDGDGDDVNTVTLHPRTKYVGLFFVAVDGKVENFAAGTADSGAIDSNFGLVPFGGWFVFKWPYASINVSSATGGTVFYLAQYAEAPA